MRSSPAISGFIRQNDKFENLKIEESCRNDELDQSVNNSITQIGMSNYGDIRYNFIALIGVHT